MVYAEPQVTMRAPCLPLDFCSSSRNGPVVNFSTTYFGLKFTFAFDKKTRWLIMCSPELQVHSMEFHPVQFRELDHR